MLSNQWRTREKLIQYHFDLDESEKKLSMIETEPTLWEVSPELRQGLNPTLRAMLYTLINNKGKYKFYFKDQSTRHWSFGIRIVLFSTLWSTGSYFRIPLEAWMHAHCFSVVCCHVYANALRLSDLASRESYHVSTIFRVPNVNSTFELGWKALSINAEEEEETSPECVLYFTAYSNFRAECVFFLIIITSMHAYFALARYILDCDLGGTLWSLVSGHCCFGGIYCHNLHFNPKDEGSTFLRNVNIQLQDYTASRPRIPQSE